MARRRTEDVSDEGPEHIPHGRTGPTLRGAALRAWRQHRNYTQEQLSEEIENWLFEEIDSAQLGRRTVRYREYNIHVRTGTETVFSPSTIRKIETKGRAGWPHTNALLDFMALYDDGLSKQALLGSDEPGERASSKDKSVVADQPLDTNTAGAVPSAPDLERHLAERESHRRPDHKSTPADAEFFWSDIAVISPSRGEIVAAAWHLGKHFFLTDSACAARFNTATDSLRWPAAGGNDHRLEEVDLRYETLSSLAGASAPGLAVVAVDADRVFDDIASGIASLEPLAEGEIELTTLAWVDRPFRQPVDFDETFATVSITIRPDPRPRHAPATFVPLARLAQVRSAAAEQLVPGAPVVDVSARVVGILVSDGTDGTAVALAPIDLLR